MAAGNDAGSNALRAPLGRLDDFVGRIEMLKSDARAQGYDSLAYFLEMALIEARIQLKRQSQDGQAREAHPKNLRLPER